jgi:hypothetical protein
MESLQMEQTTEVETDWVGQDISHPNPQIHRETQQLLSCCTTFRS